MNHESINRVKLDITKEDFLDILELLDTVKDAKLKTSTRDIAKRLRQSFLNLKPS